MLPALDQLPTGDPGRVSSMLGEWRERAVTALFPACALPLRSRQGRGVTAEMTAGVRNGRYPWSAKALRAVPA